MFDWLQRHQWVYILVFILAVVMLLRATSSPEESSNSDVISNDCWYYDLDAGELFRAKRDQVPPIKTDSGHQAVWAAVFGCGGCGKDQRFVGYMLKHTDELKQHIEANPQEKSSLFGERRDGRLFSTDGKNWIAAADPHTAGMLDHFRTRCPNGDMRRCP